MRDLRGCFPAGRVAHGGTQGESGRRWRPGRATGPVRWSAAGGDRGGGDSRVRGAPRPAFALDRALDVRRDREAEGLRRPEIDSPIELRRLLYWQVPWLGAIQDLRARRDLAASFNNLVSLEQQRWRDRE